MSTRAVISFIDEYDEFHVYQHCDGYPSGIIENLERSLTVSWKLPRFEAMKSAAAYIWAGIQNSVDWNEKNKSKFNWITNENAGSIYCTKSWENHGDLEYRYEVRAKGNDLMIQVYNMENDWQFMWGGTFTQFKAQFSK